LLSVGRGLTVITKADLVDRETLEVVRAEVEEFLRGSFLSARKSPIIPVSAATGLGMGSLRQALARVAAEVTPRNSNALPRLPLDRVFTMKGFGTVVTGTLVSGTIHKEDELEIYPKGQRVRVRSVQVHGSATDRAVAGQRTALNLANIETDELGRGMTLAPPSTVEPTRRADVLLSLLPSARPLKDHSRVHLHAYTAEAMAEVLLLAQKQLVPGQTSLAQLRLPEPMLLLPGDRFIVRQFSPVITIGGGVVLDAAPVSRKLGSEDQILFLQTMDEGTPEDILLARITRRGPTGLTLHAAVAETGWDPNRVSSVIAALARADKVRATRDLFLSTDAFSSTSHEAVEAVTAFQTYNPLAPGIPREALRERLDLTPAVFACILDALTTDKRLEATGEFVKIAGHKMVMKDEEAESKVIIEKAFASAGLKVPLLHEVLGGLKVDRVRAQKLVTLLLRDKVLIKVSDNLLFHHEALDDLRTRVSSLKSKRSKIDVGYFKEMTGVSRKYAIPLLEYLDRERITRRMGDERVIL
jgi:selenocysteine-specific elongation factor